MEKRTVLEMTLEMKLFFKIMSSISLPYKWKYSGIHWSSDEKRIVLYVFNKNGWKSKNFTLHHTCGRYSEEHTMAA